MVQCFCILYWLGLPDVLLMCLSVPFLIIPSALTITGPVIVLRYHCFSISITRTLFILSPSLSLLLSIGSGSLDGIHIFYTGWNDKIVALERTTWFHFRLMKTGFLFFFFFFADHLLVGQLCTNPKSDRSLLSCLKVTQCSTSEIGDAPLYRSKLWQQDHC